MAFGLGFGLKLANAILRGTDLASYLPIKCLYCSREPRVIYQSDTHILASHDESSRISARALFSRTDHTEMANVILRGTDLASCLPIKCLYCSPRHELSTNQIPIFSRATSNQAAFQHVHSYTHDRTDHTEIDACGSYGGSCATSFLLWEGTRCVNGCRCWGSMSEALIVPIVKVLKQ